MLSITSAWGIDIQQLRQRKLHVRVIYTHATSVLLQKVHSFQKARKLSTGISSNDTRVKKAFCGIYLSSDVAFDITSFKEDIHTKRLLKRNRKAILNRKIQVPQLLETILPVVHLPVTSSDFSATIFSERSTLLYTGRFLLVFISYFKN